MAEHEGTEAQVTIVTLSLFNDFWVINNEENPLTCVAEALWLPLAAATYQYPCTLNKWHRPRPLPSPLLSGSCPSLSSLPSPSLLLQQFPAQCRSHPPLPDAVEFAENQPTRTVLRPSAYLWLPKHAQKHTVGDRAVILTMPSPCECTTWPVSSQAGGGGAVTLWLSSRNCRCLQGNQCFHRPTDRVLLGTWLWRQDNRM